MSGIQNSEPIWLLFTCGELFKKLSPSLFVLCICHPHLSLLCGNFIFSHSDSLFIFCCVYLHNTFLNILIISIYNPLFCLLHAILYDF